MAAAGTGIWVAGDGAAECGAGGPIGAGGRDVGCVENSASKRLRRNVSCCKAINQFTEHQSSLSLRASLMRASIVSICFWSNACAESLVERSCVASNSAICAHSAAQLS